jgi:hypothetical protein
LCWNQKLDGGVETQKNDMWTGMSVSNDRHTRNSSFTSFKKQKKNVVIWWQKLEFYSSLFSFLFFFLKIHSLLHEWRGRRWVFHISNSSLNRLFEYSLFFIFPFALFLSYSLSSSSSSPYLDKRKRMKERGGLMYWWVYSPSRSYPVEHSRDTRRLPSSFKLTHTHKLLLSIYKNNNKMGNKTKIYNNNNIPINIILSYKSLQALNSKEKGNKKETHHAPSFFFYPVA